MDIKKLYDREQIQSAVSLGARAAKANSMKESALCTSQQSEAEDSVSISALSKELSQVEKILTDDEEERKIKVNRIKQDIETGTYTVDKTAVARSLISFAADDENI